MIGLTGNLSLWQRAVGHLVRGPPGLQSGLENGGGAPLKLFAFLGFPVDCLLHGFGFRGVRDYPTHGARNLLTSPTSWP